MKKMIVALVVATMGLSSAAVAQTTPPAPAQSGLGPLYGNEMRVGVAAGTLAGIIAIGILLGDDESGTTTTTTSTK